MAIAKQNRLMTLAILLDMLMRSVLGEDEGFRKAKRQIRSRAVRQPSTRGGKGTKMPEALAERRGGNVQCTCRAQLHTSVISPLLSPLGTDIADCHRAPRSGAAVRCLLRGEMSSSRRTCPVCPEQQDNKYVRMCGGGVADARRERRPQQTAREATAIQLWARFYSRGTFFRGREVGAGRVTSPLRRCKMLQWSPGSVAKV